MHRISQQAARVQCCFVGLCKCQISTKDLLMYGYQAHILRTSSIHSQNNRQGEMSRQNGLDDAYTV